MTREQIIATLKDIKSATAYIDGVVHEMSKAIEELPVEEPEPQHLPQRQLALADVRAMQAERSSAGYIEQIRDPLGRYVVSKLSAVDPADCSHGQMTPSSPQPSWHMRRTTRPPAAAGAASARRRPPAVPAPRRTWSLLSTSSACSLLMMRRTAPSLNQRTG